MLLQQHLPFTVLKLSNATINDTVFLSFVATALTVYGIETRDKNKERCRPSLVATALTVYGIETLYMIMVK